MSVRLKRYFHYSQLTNEVLTTLNYYIDNFLSERNAKANSNVELKTEKYVEVETALKSKSARATNPVRK